MSRKRKPSDPVFALIAEHRSALDKRAKANQRMEDVRARVEAKEIGQEYVSFRRQILESKELIAKTKAALADPIS